MLKRANHNNFQKKFYILLITKHAFRKGLQCPDSSRDLRIGIHACFFPLAVSLVYLESNYFTLNLGKILFIFMIHYEVVVYFHLVVMKSQQVRPGRTSSPPPVHPLTPPHPILDYDNETERSCITSVHFSLEAVPPIYIYM